MGIGGILMAMSGTVKVPGLGTMPKKYVVVAGGGVAAVVAVGFYRKRNSASAATTPVAPVDDGSGAFDSTPVGPGGSNGLTNQFGDPVPPQIVQQTPGIETNQDWITAGSAQDLGGVDSSTISHALAKVLGNIAVTQSEAEIYHEVVGIIGPPPQGAPAIRLTTGTANPPPAPAPVGYKMIWGPVAVTGSFVGLTLSQLQTKYAHDAAAVGAITLTPAVIASYVSQAALRNAMSPNTRLRSGQNVAIRRAVKA
jgi:hypothetical protein